MTQNHADACNVCRRPLPPPTFEDLQRGGRPRLTCGSRCKRRRDARSRLVARWARVRDRAVARGDQRMAEDATRGLEAQRAAPFTTTVRPAADQQALRQRYADEQARLRRTHAGTGG